MSEQPFVWCVVANVTRDPHPEGPDGELRLGTRRFSPGTKVYLFPGEWGDGMDRRRVLGRHRGGTQLIEIVISTRWLWRWRVQKVFQPFVVHRMREWEAMDDSEESRLKAQAMADWGNRSEWRNGGRYAKGDTNEGLDSVSG